MAERERSHTRPRGAVFVPRVQVMSAADVRRAVTRMAHEIAERNRGLQHVVLIGLQTGGVAIAQRLAATLAEAEGAAARNAADAQKELEAIKANKKLDEGACPKVHY